MTLAQAALAYAKRGWFVFPLQTASKVPMAHTAGLNDSSNDLDAVKAWWEKYPRANIGVDCGRSGLVVVDVDVKNNAKGAETFMDLVAQHGMDIFDTVTVLTPSGGRHYIFRGETSSGANVYGPGIDVRSRGGYIVAAPSRLEVGEYAWANAGDRVPIAPFPPCLVPQAKPTVSLTAETTIITGGRNVTLTGMAGKMRRQGFSGSEILAALTVFNSARCQPPLDVREVESIAKSVSRYEPAVKVAAPDRDPAEGLTFDDLAALSSVNMDWLIEGVLPRAGVLLIASAPKVGKSELARNLARCVATGTPFLRRRCQQGTVVWVGLEESPGHLLERAETMGLNRLPIVYFTQKNQTDETAWLRAIIMRHKPALVIIDTIGRFSTIEDINNYSQVMRATQPMLDMRTEFGTTFAFLHHNNKNNTVLGSTMWSGVVDTIMSLSRNDDNQRFVKTTQRSGVDMEPAALEMDQDTGVISVTEDKWLADQRIAEQRILTYLADGKCVGRNLIAQHSGRRVVIGRAALDALVSADLVKTSGSGAKGDPRLFWVDPSQNGMDKNHPYVRDIESICPPQPDLGWTPDLSTPGLGMTSPVQPGTTNPEKPNESADSIESNLSDESDLNVSDLFGYAEGRL